jgi:hypothetical protein
MLDANSAVRSDGREKGSPIRFPPMHGPQFPMNVSCQRGSIGLSSSTLARNNMKGRMPQVVAELLA